MVQQCIGIGKKALKTNCTPKQFSSKYMKKRVFSFKIKVSCNFLIKSDKQTKQIHTHKLHCSVFIYFYNSDREAKSTKYAVTILICYLSTCIRTKVKKVKVLRNKQVYYIVKIPAYEQFIV